MQRPFDAFDDSEESGGAMSFDRAVSAVLKRARLIVLFPIVLAAIVAAVVMMMPDRYEASAVVQIDPRQKSITKIDSVIPDMKGDVASIESEVEIIQSRPIILEVIDILGLRNDPEFAAPSLYTRILESLGIAAPASERSERQPAPPRDQVADILEVETPGATQPKTDDIADAFLKNLKVSRVRNTLLIDIRFQATSPEKAARIANTIAEVYLKDQIDSKSRGTATAARLLEGKIREMRDTVAEAERRVERWKADHNVYDSGSEELSEKEMTRLMEQTVAAREATTAARAKYEQAQRLARRGDPGNTLSDVLQSLTIGKLKEQLANTTRKLAELNAKYGPLHPEILKAKAERADAQGQLDAEVGRLIAQLKNEVEEADTRERQLAQSLSDLKERQVITNNSSVDLRALERDAATSKQLYETLLSRYKETAETEQFQLPDVRIIEKADAPQFPAAPKRKQLVLLSAAAGLVLGIAVALLLELMAPGISRQEDIERIFATAHLSSVPSTADDTDPMKIAKASRRVVAEPLSAYADAIRNARRELDMRRPNQEPRIILVTSSVAGEGAELIASNLAHNYAMTGSKPLLIDGDARLLPLTRQLAAERTRGLIDQIALSRPLEEAVLHDSLTGINFLPSIGPAPNQKPVPEIINSAACADAIADLKNHFDTIIISAPPLLPVIDGRILADYADQVVFVMAWQKTPKQLAKAAIKTLGGNSGKLTGIILNDVAPEAINAAHGWQHALFNAGGENGKSSGARSYAA